MLHETLPCLKRYHLTTLVAALLASLLAVTCVVNPCAAADKDTIQPSVYRQPGFWDGEFTEGTSGFQYGHPDPGSSESKTGQKNKDYPQHFWIPPLRQFEDTDPEELTEQEGHSYTPYAVLLLPVDVKYRDWKLPKGYYQIKLGQVNDGSPKTRLAAEDERPFTPSLANLKTPTYQPPTKIEKLKAKARLPWQQQPVSTVDEAVYLPPLLSTTPFPENLTTSPNTAKDPVEEQKLKERFVNTLVIKKLGKVVAVLPVLEKKAAPPDKKKTPSWFFASRFKQPIAWVESAPQGLRLYVNDGHTVFATELDTVNSP